MPFVRKALATGELERGIGEAGIRLYGAKEGIDNCIVRRRSIATYEIREKPRNTL